MVMQKSYWEDKEKHSSPEGSKAIKQIDGCPSIRMWVKSMPRRILVVSGLAYMMTSVHVKDPPDSR
jgi:hypothetical protein